MGAWWLAEPAGKGGAISERRFCSNACKQHDYRELRKWASLAMPSRYIEAAAIANQGVKLSEDYRVNK